MKFVTIFFAILMANQCFGQERFVVNIVQFRQPNINNSSTFRCVGTVFSPNHILAPASCVTLQSEFSLGVEVQIGTESTLIPAEKVIVHPEFQTEGRSNNIAVIKVTEAFSNANIHPRKLGALPTNETCHLVGWGGAQINPRQEAIYVFSPEFCDENFPQVFCTTFDTRTDERCTAIFGSPLTCTDHTEVAGFVISVENTCTINGNRFVLNYHSIGGFQEWIHEVSAADKYAKISSALLILSAVLISVKNMM